jgi:hypothetical protein
VKLRERETADGWKNSITVVFIVKQSMKGLSELLAGLRRIIAESLNHMEESLLKKVPHFRSQNYMQLNDQLQASNTVE